MIHHHFERGRLPPPRCRKYRAASQALGLASTGTTWYKMGVYEPIGRNGVTWGLYKWQYNWVSRGISPISGVITLLLTGSYGHLVVIFIQFRYVTQTSIWPKSLAAALAASGNVALVWKTTISFWKKVGIIPMPFASPRYQSFVIKSNLSLVIGCNSFSTTVAS